MALYAYQAFSKDGKKVTGSIDASSEQAVKQQLARQGLFPVSIILSKETAGFQLRQLFQRSVSAKDKILFSKQLSVLLKSDVPLLQALELLIGHFEGQLNTIIVELKDNLKEGKSLADGLQQYPRTFSNIYIQLVRAGEATGNLEIILDRLVEYLVRQETIYKRIKSAMTYPLIQLTIACVVVGILMTMVVPKMVESFADIGTELPASTQLLIGMSNFLQSYYILLGIVLIGSTIGFLYWRSTSGGRRALDRLKLRLPIIKFFARIGAVTQFCRTLGMLVEGGVNLSEALDIVCKIIDNRILADALIEARENIIRQGRIAEYLKKTEIFPSIAIYLIKTGEESGKLDLMLNTVAQNYEDELSEYADGLSSLINPIMLVVMGVVVGFIVMSIAQPMMNMQGGLEELM